LVVPNDYELFDDTFLDVKLIINSDEKNLTLQDWYLLSFTKDSMVMQLNFSSPLKVSSST